MRQNLRFAVDADAPSVRKPFSVMAKPGASRCNLDCRYCYYLEKESLYPSASSWVMSDAVLDAYVRGMIEDNDLAEIGFLWQGGEPTLLGIGFFEKALALQRRYAGRKAVTNAIQTNGVLLDEDWCRFLRDHGFLVGLSLDGPEDLHDAHRIDKRGRPTFARVMRAWELLSKHAVETNILSVVNRTNGEEPLRVYRFLKSIGAEYLQFIPVVERVGAGGGLAGPPALDAEAAVTEWSVLPEQYGEFLVTVYDEWVREDVGAVFVQLFDVCLNVWLGQAAPLCWFNRSCGTALVVEHNGDLYSCDHFVYPEYRLGNVVDGSMAEMARSKRQTAFGTAKNDSLPRYCRSCDVRFICNGECPKRRFLRTPDGDPGLNYLCAAYQRFFRHVDPTMREMAGLVRKGLPADLVRGRRPLASEP